MRNLVIFGGAVATGIAAFVIAYGHDRGAPMVLPVLPKPPAHAAIPPAPPAHLHSAATAPATAPMTTPASTPATTAPAMPVAANTVQQLTALGAAATKHLGAVAPAASCKGLDKKPHAALRKRVRAWIDAQHPDERIAESDIEDMQYVFDAGCPDASGILVDASMDRKAIKGDGRTRRNYVLHVTGDRIDVIAERTSTPSIYWMEWADEGRLALIGEADLDGDGARDTIYVDIQHEGGATHSPSQLLVRYANGTVAPIVSTETLAGAYVDHGQLIVGAQDRQLDRTYYRCVDASFELVSCAAAATMQRLADKYDAVTRLQSGVVPDRDQLAADFATLHITGHDDLLAAVPATPPVERTQRHVQQFLAAAFTDPAEGLVVHHHHVAQAFFDALSAQLGDTACTPTPLTDAERARVLAWVATQAKQPDGVTPPIERTCGDYVWVSFQRGDAAEEALIILGDKITRVTTLPGQQYEGPGSQTFGHGGAFFRHGATVVGVVLSGSDAWVVANGKLVAHRHGDFRMFDYDRRWSTDASTDVVVEGTTLWHPTLTGFEKLDPEPVRAHQVQREAIERLTDDPPSNAAPYLAALRTLGAPPALIAECKALAP